MASWNSTQLEVLYQVLGWTAFVSWSFSFYPQVILNFRRKSVVGLNFNFVVLNLTKHSSYLIYNCVLYFSPVVQEQYHEKYGYGEMIPVAANDVAFSIHAVLLTVIALFQIAIYDRGTQKISRLSIVIVVAAWLTATVCFFIALPHNSWLWLISIFKKWEDVASFYTLILTPFLIYSSIQVFITMIKYIPQVVMNFVRKSTDGFSIGYVLLDFLGGMANYAQMAVQSVDQGSWVNFYGNVGKTSISLICMFFDLLFMCQHFILFSSKKPIITAKASEDLQEELIKSADEPQSQIV